MPATKASERFVAAGGGARLCTEAFGAPGDPAVLLVMGQMASMLWWRDGFCERLATAGRFVLRYDHRDTGRSTAYPPGAPGYTGDDMVADGVAVLDGHGVTRAHLVGMSMGGALAQLLALAYPERVATLTLISSTPVAGGPEGLPGPDAAYLRHAAGGAEVDWADPLDFLLSDCRALGGDRPFDEAAMRAFLARDLARTTRPESLPNHTLIPEASPRPASSPRRCSSSTARPIRSSRSRTARHWRRQNAQSVLSSSRAAGTSCTSRTGPWSSTPSWSTRRPGPSAAGR